MTERLHDALTRAADSAPGVDLDPDVLWRYGQRARTRNRLVTAVVTVLVVSIGTALFALADSTGGDVPPTDGSERLGFPDDLYDVPSRTPTTDEAGPLGPLALIGTAEHQGYWPWSEREQMVYGVSGHTGEYRFLSLPGFTPGEALFGAASALSPDGDLVAYVYRHDGSPVEGADGIAVYDTTSGEVDTYTPPSGRGFGVAWLAWAPDSGALVAGMSPRGAPEGLYTNAGSRVVRYDVESGTFTQQEDDGRWSLESNDQVTWKPAHVDSPAGLAVVRDSQLTLLDPETLEPIESYTWPRALQIRGALMWDGDGSAFSAVIDLCTNTCRPDDRWVVRGTVPVAGGAVDLARLSRAEMDVTTVIGSTDGAVVRFAGREDKVLMVTGPDEPGVAYSLSAEDLAWDSVQVAQEALAAGIGSGATERPAQPAGWQALVWLAVLIGFAVAFLLRLLPAGGSVRQAWRGDAVALVLLVPALTAAASVWARQLASGFYAGAPMSVDIVTNVVVLALAWLVARRNHLAWLALLVGTSAAVIVQTAELALADVGWRGVVPVLLGGCQVAVLLSPAVRSWVRPSRELVDG